MLEAVLLPFGDKIIYDSYLGFYSINFGDGEKGEMEILFKKVLTKGIVTAL